MPAPVIPRGPCALPLPSLQHGPRRLLGIPTTHFHFTLRMKVPHCAEGAWGSTPSSARSRPEQEASKALARAPGRRPSVLGACVACREGGQAVRAPGAGGGRVRICAAARVLPAQGSLPGGPGVQGLGLPCCGTVRPRPAGDGRSSRYPESKAARAGRKGRRPCGASVPRTPPRFRRARDSAPTPSTEQGLAPCSPARRCPSQPAPPTSSPPHTLPALGAHRIKSPGGWGFHPHQRQPRRVTLTWP